MMRSNLYRSATAPFFVGALAAAVLAFAPSAVFAQRGGGGGGHASAGGGGGHFGGGGGFSGSHASAPAASHSSAKPATRSAPVANSRPPVATSARPATTSTGAVNARQTLFGTPATSGSGSAVALHAQGAAPRTTVIGFPPTDSHTWQAAPAHSGPVSFSGQGHEIWQDSPSRSGNSTVNAAPLASRGVFSGRTSATAVRPVPPHKIFFPGGSAPIIFVPEFGFFGSGFGFGFFGNGFGCDPFFGWGFNLGFGCNPYSYGLGYGYGGFYGPGYGYNFAPGYDSSYSVGQSSSDSSSDAASDAYGAYSAASPSLQNSDAAPSDAASANDGDAAASANAAPSAAAAPPPPPTTIYMKDGTSYEVMSYWLDAGKLHYITNYGGETSIDMSQLDLQRTVDENAAHGGSFTLLPAPATNTAPAQESTPNPEPAPAPQQ